MYWQLQWERNAQLEEQRLSVSNYVIGASVVALGIFSVTTATSSLAAYVLAIAVAVTNVLAIVYGLRSEQWARMHKNRARSLLEANWQYLRDLQVDIPRPHNGETPLRRLGFQVWIHVVIAVAAVVLAIWS
jgi:hypothetical protein